jgi:hypothetical protein
VQLNSQSGFEFSEDDVEGMRQDKHIEKKGKGGEGEFHVSV